MALLFVVVQDLLLVRVTELTEEDHGGRPVVISLVLNHNSTSM